MATTRITIVLEIEGDPDDVRQAVNACLDQGMLQDSINLYNVLADVHVTSAVMIQDERELKPPVPPLTIEQAIEARAAIDARGWKHRTDGARPSDRVIRNHFGMSRVAGHFATANASVEGDELIFNTYRNAFLKACGLRE